MKIKTLSLFCAISITTLILFAQNGNSAEDPGDPIQMLKDAKQRFESINDYTAIFVKRQFLRGRYQYEEMEMKYKKPFAVYYRWITPESDKEVLYVQGKNNNKLIGHMGGAASILRISKWLYPDDPIAMRGNRYPITKSGIGNMIDSLLQQYELAKKNGDLDSFHIGTERLDGRETYVILRRLPEKPEYACYISIVNIDKKTGLPIRVISYDWDLNLEQAYYYKNLQINVGLTDKDFDPNNKKYKFGIFKF